MNRRLTPQEFNLIINKNYPHIKIISEFKGTKYPVLVQDNLNIIYKIRADSLLIGYKISISSAIDKNEAFKIKAKLIHGYFYDYSKVIYKNMKTKVILICPIHGEFEQNSRSHLEGFGCTKCTGQHKPNKEEFINKFSKIHNNRYDYSLVEYGANNNEKVKIICPIHGIFEQTPRLHLTSGCPKCYNPGYDKSRWINIANKHKKACLYIIKASNNEESFIKIGITSYNLKTRFITNTFPYEIEQIKVISSNPSVIWDEEKRLHRLFKQYKYKPNQIFHGSTECFTLDILPLIQNFTDLYPLSPY